MTSEKKAPQATVHHPVWSTAQKSWVGTALGSARLWFTVGRGIVTEVFYPRIDIPQIRDLGFIVADDAGFWQELKLLPQPHLELNDPQVPLPVIHHHHERFDFTLRICADAERDVLLLDFVLDGDVSVRPYVLCATRLGVDAENNRAWAATWDGRSVLWAEQGPFGLALACRDSNGRSALEKCSVGEVGASDLWHDFHKNGRMEWEYDEAGPGETALGGRLPRQGTLALAFGTSREAAATNAWGALVGGFSHCVATYTANWKAWHGSHPASPALIRQLPTAVQNLYARSATVLKVHEDRTFPGALVASLSVPWGESSDSRGGYHLVWPRDLVESAGALLALGAESEARQVLIYLISTQQSDGHWLQNQWLGGKPFWQGIQLDETAFPVLLAGALRQHKLLNDVAVTDMIFRALQFIAREGPVTDQDRWEEDSGVSLFTMSVVIAALVEGAEFLEGDARDCALMLADYWNARLEDWTAVYGTGLAKRFGVAGHYMRITPRAVLIDEDAKNDWLAIKNLAEDPHLAASAQVSTGFLQLVRYGLRAADDPLVRASVTVVDGLLKTETPNGPVWHRYSGDGYGEHPDGSPFDGSGKGRGWPLLIGERGHYAILAGADPRPYMTAMTQMAGDGGLIPEQVWDTDAIPERGLFLGQPSGSAMPLVWAHGEFVKLCQSYALGYPVDRPPATWKRYQGRRPSISYRIWGLRQRPRALPEGQELRVLLPDRFLLHWGINGWQSARDSASQDLGLAHIVLIPSQHLRSGESIQFTFYWTDRGQWQGQDFQVTIEGGRA